MNKITHYFVYLKRYKILVSLLIYKSYLSLYTKIDFTCFVYSKIDKIITFLCT